MPAFYYEATTLNGDSTSGFLDAADLADAKRQLSERELTITLLDATDPVGADAPRAEAVNSPSGQLTADEHVEAIAQIGTLIESRVPLHIGMRTLAEELPGRKLRKTFARMSDRLQNGDLLEKVVTDEGGALPPFLAGLLQTGVASDRLSECVERYVAFTRLRFDLRAQVWLSLLYPLVLAVIGGGLLFLLALTIFPQFKIIFEGFYVELPGLTRLIIGTGDVVVAIVNMGYAGLLLIAAIVWGMYVVVRYAALKRPGFWQTLYVIPIAGDVVRSSGISQFCYLMGIMVSRGVDLPQALQLTSQSLSDRNIALGTQRMSELIGAGHSPASLRRHVALPREILSLFIWKNENNELATALTASGELYAAQCDINAKCLSSIVTPLIVLVVGAAIAMSVFGLFMPLINLMNDLS